MEKGPRTVVKQTTTAASLAGVSAAETQTTVSQEMTVEEHYWKGTATWEVAESGRRLTRSKFLAKRLHSGGHCPEKKNGKTSRKASGRAPDDLLPLAPRPHFDITPKFR